MVKINILSFTVVHLYFWDLLFFNLVISMIKSMYYDLFDIFSKVFFNIYFMILKCYEVLNLFLKWINNK